MRRLLITMFLAACFAATPGVAHAGQATAPSAACNAGTLNAHTQVPEETGAGVPVAAHEHIPDGESGICVHEAFA
jgi:hypothetical protein